MAKRAKPPPGCYWRGSTLWAAAMVNGRRCWWSLDTSDPAIAKKRREAGKARLVADANHGDAQRSLEEATVAWEAHLARQVDNGVLGRKTKTRYLCLNRTTRPLPRRADADRYRHAFSRRHGRGARKGGDQRDDQARPGGALVPDELRPRQGVGRTEPGPDQAAARQGGQAFDRTASPRGHRSRALPRAGHARAARPPRDGDRRKTRRAGHLEARPDRS